MANLPTAAELIGATVTEAQFKAALKILIENVSSRDEVLQGLVTYLGKVDLKSENLFRHWTLFGYTNNMNVRRYTAVNTFNDYVAGTYQSKNEDYIDLSVLKAGSSAIKHYFDTGIVAQKFEAEFKVTLQDIAGDAVGVGFKNGENYNIVAFSNSGNLSTVSDYTNTVVTSGLGGYGVGDVIHFIYDGIYMNIYVNNIFKGKAALSQAGTIALGQMGFSQYSSIAGSKSVDPVREYVLGEIAKIPTQDPTVLPQAKTYTETYVHDQSIDLFKKSVSVPYTNNMTVTRFTAASTSNTYTPGTYQALNGSKVNLSVLKAGSSAIKHYFVSGITAQALTAEFKVNLQDVAGDAIGIGFKNGENYNIVAFSNSGNLSTVSGFTNTVVTSGLGGYGVGDIVKFTLMGDIVKVYVNGVFKAQQTLSSTAGVLIIGQGGFSQYESSIVGASTDPIREYVKTEIAEVAKGDFSKCYYSFELGVSPLLGAFKVYTQVKNDLYVGFEIKHEYDVRDLIYQNYWRIYQALFYKFADGVMQPTGKTALGGGESEFVLKTNATKVDFTGGYHGDEIFTDVKFLADGISVSTSANIALKACEQFEYIEKSTMHETADANGFIADHPKIADHIKHTVFKNAGYKTLNKCTWNYAGLMTIIYHGIACIHKDVAAVVFSDDTYTDQAMTASTNNYFNAIGARLYKGRNEENGLAVEAAAYQVAPSEKDALSEFFVHDRSTDSKYYRKTPAFNVSIGEKHESYFECKFMAI